MHLHQAKRLEPNQPSSLLSKECRYGVGDCHQVFADNPKLRPARYPQSCFPRHWVDIEEESHLQLNGASLKFIAGKLLRLKAAKPILPPPHLTEAIGKRCRTLLFRDRQYPVCPGTYRLDAHLRIEINISLDLDISQDQPGGRWHEPMNNVPIAKRYLIAARRVRARARSIRRSSRRRPRGGGAG